MDVRRCITAILFPFLGAACDDFTGPELEDLEGVWRADQVEMIDPDTQQRVEWFRDGWLAEFTMTIARDGVVTIAAREPGEDEPDIATGTITCHEWNVSIVANDDALVGTFALDGRRLWIFVPEWTGLGPTYRLTMTFTRM